MKLDLLPHIMHKVTQSGSNLNIIAKTIKLLEENMGVNLCDPVLGNGFLYITLKYKQQKKTGKLGIIKI